MQWRMMAMASATAAAFGLGSPVWAASAAPTALTVAMTPHMVQGTGHVTYRRDGEQVEIQVSARDLPEPHVYVLCLSGPEGPTVHTARRVLGQAPTLDGNVRFSIWVPRAELAGWTHLGLMHLPSGAPHDFRNAHDAMVSVIPEALP